MVKNKNGSSWLWPRTAADSGCHDHPDAQALKGELNEKNSVKAQECGSQAMDSS